MVEGHDGAGVIDGTGDAVGVMDGLGDAVGAYVGIADGGTLGHNGPKVKLSSIPFEPCTYSQFS